MARISPLHRKYDPFVRRLSSRRLMVKYNIGVKNCLGRITAKCSSYRVVFGLFSLNCKDFRLTLRLRKTIVQRERVNKKPSVLAKGFCIIEIIIEFLRIYCRNSFVNSVILSYSTLTPNSSNHHSRESGKEVRKAVGVEKAAA